MQKRHTQIGLLSLIAVMLLSRCSEGSNDGAHDKGDGGIFGSYESIKIGNQTWMQYNLAVTEFRNGDPIPEARTEKEWIDAGRNEQPAMCYLGSDPNDEKGIGLVYNWYAVNDIRELAPSGWRIPTNEDWNELIEYCGGEKSANSKLKNPEYWSVKKVAKNQKSNSEIGETGFNCVPAPSRLHDGFYGDPDDSGASYFWSSTEANRESVWSIYVNSANQSIRRDFSKRRGLSVRCIRD